MPMAPACNAARLVQMGKDWVVARRSIMTRFLSEKPCCREANPAASLGERQEEGYP